MGNNSYQPQICLNCTKWQSSQLSPHQFVHQHLLTHQKILQHILQSSSSNTISNDISIYQWRLKNNGRNNLVQLIQVNIPQRQHSCCSYSPKFASLITEYINPIHQIDRLDPLQIANLINDWITGFSLLYKQFGYFTVEGGMLGWNSRTIGKVWINSNFSTNKVHSKIQCRSGFEFQRYVMKRIAEIIIQNYHRRQAQFIQELKSISNYNFGAAKQKIRKIIHNLQNPSSHHFSTHQNTQPPKNPHFYLRQNYIQAKIKEPKRVEVCKSPIHPQSPNFKFQYRNRQYQPLIPKQNITILKPRAPSLVKMAPTKIRSRSCAGHKYEQISQIETHVPEYKQSYKLTTNPSITSNSKVNTRQSYCKYDNSTEKTRKRDEKEINDSEECKLDLSVVESVLTVKREQQNEIYYKIEESIIIRGMD